MVATGPDPAVSPLTICLFGPFEVRRNGLPLPRFRFRKSPWLLALVTLRSPAEVEREWLAGVLWPESVGSQGLRNSLTELRRALGPEAGRLHSPTPYTLLLDLTEAEADVVAFDAAIARGDPASLHQAVALYRGPLLEGCSEEWVFQERQAREQAYLTALEALAAQALAGGEAVAAERHLRRAVGVDPLRESAQRTLMQLLAGGGNYAAALLVYRELRLRLHRELNTAPDPATTALFQQLRAEAHRRAPARTPAWASLSASPPTRPPRSQPLIPEGTVPFRFPDIESSTMTDDVRGETPAIEPQPSPPPSLGALSVLHPVPGPGARSAPAGTGSPEVAVRVVLLSARNAQPEEQLLQLLEVRLNAHDYQVFVDRHMAIGEDWAREIAHQIRTADAVIPLLSAASVPSEMLEYELQIAHRAAQQQAGKPRLLPVRVHYTDPLPDPLAPILGPLPCALWEGPQENERLVEELLNALRKPLALRPPVPPGKLELVRGALPPDSPFYVERSTDAEFLEAIARHDSIVLVKGPRQMGKTSLLARGLQRAREAGDRVVQTDLQLLNAAHLTSAETLYLTLAGWIADQLELEVFLDQVWTPRRGASGNFTWYVQREVLGKSAAPIVWGLDEVDALIPCDFASEVFGLFRSWHNQRALDPTGRWARLTLAIAYATEPHLFIQNLHQSPFNVGTQVTLRDFTLEEISELNRRYDDPLPDPTAVERYARLVGGHPYLVHRGLQEMVKQGIGRGCADALAAFEAQADCDDGIFGDHLKRLLMLLVGTPPLCDEVREVLRGRPCRSVDSFYRLRSAGVVTGDSPREARLRCRLYATYLERYLL